MAWLTSMYAVVVLLLLLALLLELAMPMVTVSLEGWEHERGVAVKAVVGTGGEADFAWVELLGVAVVELCGSSAGGAATATFTRASKAEVEFVVVVLLLVEEEVLLGWNAIMDFSDDDVVLVLLLLQESVLCLE